MSNPTEIAERLFQDKFNCAQAVFAAFAPAAGLQEELALRLASPFGGGMAQQGQVCGAVTGALLALGLRRGASTPAGKEETYRLAQEFIRRFTEKHGTIICRQLIDCDLSTPEGRQLAHDRGVRDSICMGLVRDAAEMVRPFLVDRS